MEEQKRKAAEESSDHKLREKKEERGAKRTRAGSPAWVDTTEQGHDKQIYRKELRNDN